MSSYTPNRVVITDPSGYISVSSVSSQQLAHLSNIETNVQQQLDNKQELIRGSTGDTSARTANRIIITNENGQVVSSPTPATSLLYLPALDNVRSNLQEQLDSKQASLTFQSPLQKTLPSTISISRASSQNSGYLHADDFVTFLNKQAPLPRATTTVSGFLHRDDFVNFSQKQRAITSGPLVSLINNPQALSTRKVLITNSSGNIESSSLISVDHLNTLALVTSDIQTQLNNKSPLITGSAASIVSTVLTGNRVVITDSLGQISTMGVSTSSLGYIQNLQSDCQTQLNSKQDIISGAATSITTSNLSSNRILISNAQGKVAASSVSGLQLTFLKNCTEDIQNALDKRLILSSQPPEVTGSREGNTALLSLLQTLHNLGIINNMTS